MPWAFVDLLRVALAKLVGSGWLHPNLGGLEFWAKFPIKYQTRRSYEKSKVNKLFQPFSIFNIRLPASIDFLIIRFTLLQRRTTPIEITPQTSRKRTLPKILPLPSSKKAKLSISDNDGHESEDILPDLPPISPRLSKKKPDKSVSKAQKCNFFSSYKLTKYIS